MSLVAICVFCIPSIYSPIFPVFSSFTRSKKSLRDFVGTVTQSLLTATQSLRNLYAGQEETVRTGHGTTDWFQIGKGVH